MDWTLRGWAWYVRGAICRRLGPDKNLISSIFLLVLCVILLAGFHVTLFGGYGEINAGYLKRSLWSSGQYEEDADLAVERESSDYPEEEEGKEFPSKPQGGPDAPSRLLSPPKNMEEKGHGIKNKLKKKKNKAFKQHANIKKGSIDKRTDKLMFPRSDFGIKNKHKQLLPSRYTPLTGLQIYQEDSIIENEIEWNLKIEQERRRELRQRSLRVRRECDNDVRGKLNRIISKVYDHLQWVNRYDLIWCPVFKAGSTTWKKYLLLLSGETHFDGSLHRKASSLYPSPKSPQMALNLLDKSLKFMIVRHPFDRLLSAYRDKMLRITKNDDSYRRLQLKILEKYRDIRSEGPSAETMKEEEEEEEEEGRESSSRDPHNPTFLQFLHKVRDDMKVFWEVMDGAVVDPHWTPYWYSCAPCQVHYDIIAKVETLDLDQEFILRAANLKGILPNAHTHASKNDAYQDSDVAAAKYFEQIPVELLKELQELYWPDFTLYGYTSEKYLKMAKSDV